uniref:hypothetical protein n=1 Tax=uncultured Polaribacter sp. TaxID=174711 RepID=UPI00259AF1B9
KNISFINFVHIEKNETAVEVIKKIKPTFYCKGKDFLNQKNDLTNNIIREIKETEKYGGKFKVIHTKMFSSSSLINDRIKNYTKSILIQNFTLAKQSPLHTMKLVGPDAMAKFFSKYINIHKCNFTFYHILF